MSENLPPNQGCTQVKAGWYCSRKPGHEGPCAARPLVSLGQTWVSSVTDEGAPDMFDGPPVPALPSSQPASEPNIEVHRAIRNDAVCHAAYTLGLLEGQRLAERAYYVTRKVAVPALPVSPAVPACDCGENWNDPELPISAEAQDVYRQTGHLPSCALLEHCNLFPECAPDCTQEHEVWKPSDDVSPAVPDKAPVSAPKEFEALVIAYAEAVLEANARGGNGSSEDAENALYKWVSIHLPTAEEATLVLSWHQNETASGEAPREAEIAAKMRRIINDR